MVCSCIGIVISFGMLILTIKRSFVWTFVTTKSGNEYVQDIFSKGEDNEAKFKIFECNEYKWRQAIGEDVQKWLAKALTEWANEKPRWLNKERLSIVSEWVLDDSDPVALERLRILIKVQKTPETPKTSRIDNSPSFTSSSDKERNEAGAIEEE